MAKSCTREDCNNHRFSGGYCFYHQSFRTDKKQKELKKSPLKKSNKQINKQSKKTKKLTTIYLKERTKFLDGKICPITGRSSTEIHHIDGREYERLIDKTRWLAVTREGHQYIHSNPKWSREKGYLI
jgi:hypothetical protein